PSFSAEGGSGACSIPANAGGRFGPTVAERPTTAFLESDRRDLPGADERYGDDAEARDATGAPASLGVASSPEQASRRNAADFRVRATSCLLGRRQSARTAALARRVALRAHAPEIRA